jgi:hypothetical protein
VEELEKIKYYIKMDFTEIRMWERALNPFGSINGRVVGCCEHGKPDNISGSTKERNVMDN